MHVVQIRINTQTHTHTHTHTHIYIALSLRQPTQLEPSTTAVHSKSTSDLWFNNTYFVITVYFLFVNGNQLNYLKSTIPNDSFPPALVDSYHPSVALFPGPTKLFMHHLQYAKAVAGGEPGSEANPSE